MSAGYGNFAAGALSWCEADMKEFKMERPGRLLDTLWKEGLALDLRSAN